MLGLGEHVSDWGEWRGRGMTVTLKAQSAYDGNHTSTSLELPSMSLTQLQEEHPTLLDLGALL